MEFLMPECKHELAHKKNSEPQSYDRHGEPYYGVYDMHCKLCKVELTTLIGMSPSEIEAAKKQDEATKKQYTKCQKKKT
jgi:hypothetical protein